MSALLFWPLARVWSLAARARARLYRHGSLTQRRLERPVVSIGNLSAGGTGKTPFVIWLWKELAERGIAASVLTRGYRRTSTAATMLLEGRSAPDSAAAGDEVQVMLRNGVEPIAVDANRWRGGRALEARSDIALHLLDDGFQHLQLARDLDIVLLDSTTPFWKDDLLPAGRLREPLPALARAQVIILTRVREWTDVELFCSYARLWSPRAEIFVTRTTVDGAMPAERYLSPGEPLAAGWPAAPSAPSLAFSGIGNPKAFVADLCLAGFKVVGNMRFRDHHRYSVRDLRRVQQMARKNRAEHLVTTEKDAANLPSGWQGVLDLPLSVAHMSLEVDRASSLLQRVLRLAAGAERTVAP